MVSWRRSLADDAGLELAFQSRSTPFMVTGSHPDKDIMIMEASLCLAFAPSASLNLGYTGELGQSSQSHGVKGNLAIGF